MDKGICRYAFQYDVSPGSQLRFSHCTLLDTFQPDNKLLRHSDSYAPQSDAGLENPVRTGLRTMKDNLALYKIFVGLSGCHSVSERDSRSLNPFLRRHEEVQVQCQVAAVDIRTDMPLEFAVWKMGIGSEVPQSYSKLGTRWYVAAAQLVHAV